MILQNLSKQDTICALATAAGSGAIAIIRISGPQSIQITQSIFTSYDKLKDLNQASGYSIHFGKIHQGERLIDEVLVSVFKNPKSYTGEDSIEISCHGSTYIQQQILTLLSEKGCRQAQAGEFTLRAFLNGKFDLSQAEAVADLIASNSASSHQLALQQMRGGFSHKIAELRKELLDFASLMELELDFSEEDVEFADREKFYELLSKIRLEVEELIESFKLGNVLKHGIPVAIVGKPNAGKSTLLNRILKEEKAIVSDIPGTTRDAIEDTIIMDGTAFRFIDTAGLRESGDKIENLGIERTYAKIRESQVVLYVCDLTQSKPEELAENLEDFKEHIENKNKQFIIIGNKTDELTELPSHFTKYVDLETIFISAKRNENIHLIGESLKKTVAKLKLQDQTIVSNARHLDILNKVADSINSIEEAFQNDIPTDLIAIDVHQALHFLGEITGEVTNDELLGNIFGRFCIGNYQ
ncbi:MAG: tRNA uridine-5-carboxymethylaminomethyl(34) synthesis GTPase MnmE [Bacteroidetes bacterium 4572_77]|nr:MAG: tRNA uridine-5-carboxymethylaminomethyl(34) synthesis GTPase MnmE [Bacteroidetes bacterium 4572_77]